MFSACAIEAVQGVGAQGDPASVAGALQGEDAAEPWLGPGTSGNTCRKGEKTLRKIEKKLVRETSKVREGGGGGAAGTGAEIPCGRGCGGARGMFPKDTTACGKPMLEQGKTVTWQKILSS